MCCSSRDINFISIEHVPIMMFFNIWHVPIVMFSNNDIFTGSNIDIAHGEHVLGASSLVDPYPGWMSAQLAKKGEQFAAPVVSDKCYPPVIALVLTWPVPLLWLAPLLIYVSRFILRSKLKTIAAKQGDCWQSPPYQASSSWITWMEAHREEFKGVLRRWG